MHKKATSSKFRSELSVDIITDMLATKQNQTVMCCDYEPTENVLQKAKKATMQYNLQHKLKVVDKKEIVVILLIQIQSIIKMLDLEFFLHFIFDEHTMMLMIKNSAKKVAIYIYAKPPSF